MAIMQSVRNPYYVLGQHLQRQREKKGMTQEMLAEETGYSPHHISHIETGQKKPSVDFLIAVAKALGMKVKDLIPF